MVKLVALYKKPADPKDFDDQYFNTHLPLAEQNAWFEKVGSGTRHRHANG